MFIAKRSVRVIRVPSEVSKRDYSELLRDHAAYAADGRTSVVLDCSAILGMSHATKFFLLGCLEASLMTNGDVRLAGLCSQAHDDLAQSGISALFEHFDTVASATASFSKVVSTGASSVNLRTVHYASDCVAA